MHVVYIHIYIYIYDINPEHAGTELSRFNQANMMVADAAAMVLTVKNG